METKHNYLLSSGFYDELAITEAAAAIRSERQPVKGVAYPELVFSSTYYETGLKDAKKSGGIVAYETDQKMHFGNPFIKGIGKDMTFLSEKITSVREAVQAYHDWLIGVEEYRDIEPGRRQWIIDQILSGELIGKPVIDLSETIPEGKGGYQGYKVYTSPFAKSSAMVLLEFINRPEDLAAAINGEQRVRLDIKGEAVSASRLPYKESEVASMLKWIKEQPEALKESIDLTVAGEGGGVYLDEWFNTLSPDARAKLMSRSTMKMLSDIMLSAKIRVPVREVVDHIIDDFKPRWDENMLSDVERSAFIIGEYKKLPVEAKGILAQFMRLYVGIDHQKDVTKMDMWFSSLSTAEKAIIMDPSTIEMVSRFEGMDKYGDDCKRAMDDIVSNIRPDLNDSFKSEAKRDSFYNEIFFGLPVSVRNAIYSKMSSETYRKNLSASFEFIMVGVGKRSFNEVMACIPNGVTLVVDVRSSTGTAKDKRLQKANIGDELKRQSIKYMHVQELAYKDAIDLDQYSSYPHIREKIDEVEKLLVDENGHRRQIVLLTNETSPAKGISATGLGQALERDGYNVVYNSIYPGTLKSYTRTHAQVIGSILNNYVIEEGKISQIHFYNNGKHYSDPGVVLREHIVPQADRRIRGRDNYDNPVKPVQMNDLYPMSVVNTICRSNSADVVFIATFGEVNQAASVAKNIANERAIQVRLRPDPQMLLSREYAEKKAAECFADYQGIMDYCLRNKADRQKRVSPQVIDYAHLSDGFKMVELAKANAVINAIKEGKDAGIHEAFSLDKAELKERLAQACFDQGVVIGVSVDNVIDGRIPEGVSWEDVKEKYVNYATVIIDGLESRFGLENIVNQRVVREDIIEAIAEEGHNFWFGKLRDAGWEYGKEPKVQVNVNAAFVGSTESAMMVEKVKKAATDWELAMLEKAEAVDSETGFAMSETMMDGRTLYGFGANSSGKVGFNSMSLDNDSRVDTMKMTGVTEDIMKVFFKNFFEAVERGVSYASLYTSQQLNIDEEETITEYQVDRERRKIAGKVYKNLGLQRTMKDASKAYDECKGVEEAYMKDAELDKTFTEFKESFYGGEDNVPDHVKSYKRGESFAEFRKHFFSVDNKEREEFIENYTIESLPSVITRCMSPCNPGLQRAALLATQAMGRETVPVLAKNNEVTAFISTVRGGIPINWRVYEGRKGRIDYTNHAIVLAPGQGEAYILNAFHMGVGTEKEEQFDVRAEQEIRRLYTEQHETDVRPGLTPIQIRALSQKLRFSQTNIRAMNDYLVSNDTRIRTPESMMNFLQECESVLNIHRPGGELSASEVNEALEFAIRQSEEELEKGIGSVSIMSDHFPAVLKGWNGYDKEEKGYSKNKVVDFVYVTDEKGKEIEGSQIDESVIKGLSEGGDGSVGVVHVEHDTAVQKEEKPDAPVVRHEPSPSLLYYRGDLSVLERPTVMIHGDSATESQVIETRSAIARVVEELVSEGVSIVSVLRPGTNLLALKEAVDKGNRVIAILPEGFQKTKYDSIIDDIVSKGGCVVSEVDPDTSRGLMYDQGRVSERAERMASVIGKHVLFIDLQKEHGTGNGNAYDGIIESATNGVSVIDYVNITDPDDRRRVSGNDQLLKERDGVQAIVSDSLQGLTEVVRLAWAVSPMEKEVEVAEKREEEIEMVRKADRPQRVSVDKLPFYVVRNEDEQVFVVKEMYADVRDTIRKTYGEEVEFVGTIEEAEDRLYGNAIDVMGTRVDTFEGWRGTEPLVSRPYKVPLIYYKDVIYTPTNAPEAAIGITDEIRTQHRSFFERIVQEAERIQKKINEELQLSEDAPAIRIANSRYFVISPTEVTLCQGLGDNVEEDRVLSRISIGENGLLNVFNYFFAVEGGEESIIRKPQGRKDQISWANIGDILTDMDEAIFGYSRRMKEMYVGATREERDELDKNFESGFYKVEEIAIDNASIVPYLGKTIFEPAAEQKSVPSREEAMMYLNIELAAEMSRFNKLSKRIKDAEMAIFDKTSEIQGAEDVEDEAYVEHSDNIQSAEQDIAIFTEDRDAVSKRIASIEMSRKRLALADKIYLAQSDSEKDVVVLSVGGSGIELDTSKKPSGKKLESALGKASKDLEDIRKQVLDKREAMGEIIYQVEGAKRSVNRIEVEAMLKARRQEKLMDPNVYEEEVVQKLKNGKSIIKREGVYTIVNRDLSFVVNPPVYYAKMEQMGDSQRILVQKENGKFNVINSSGSELFGKDYNVIRNGEDRIGEVFDGQKWRFINWATGGKFLSEGAYEEVRSFKNGFAAVRIGEFWTFVEDPRVKHENLDKGLALQRESDAAEGKPFTVFYNDVRDFNEGVAAVYVKGKGWNLIDKDDNLFLKPDESLFSEVSDFHDGKAVGVINGETVAFNFDGDRVDPITGALLEEKTDEQEKVQGDGFEDGRS